MDEDPHVGASGQVWLKHPYEIVEDDDDGFSSVRPSSRFRAECVCGWTGQWRHHEAVAEQDGEQHPETGDYGWNQSWPQQDRIESPPGLRVAIIAALVIVAALLAAGLAWRLGR